MTRREFIAAIVICAVGMISDFEEEPPRQRKEQAMTINDFKALTAELVYENYDADFAADAGTTVYEWSDGERTIWVSRDCGTWVACAYERDDLIADATGDTPEDALAAL